MKASNQPAIPPSTSLQQADLIPKPNQYEAQTTNHARKREQIVALYLGRISKLSRNGLHQPGCLSQVSALPDVLARFLANDESPVTCPAFENKRLSVSRNCKHRLSRATDRPSHQQADELAAPERVSKDKDKDSHDSIAGALESLAGCEGYVERDSGNVILELKPMFDGCVTEKYSLSFAPNPTGEIHPSALLRHDLPFFIPVKKLIDESKGDIHKFIENTAAHIDTFIWKRESLKAAVSFHGHKIKCLQHTRPYDYISFRIDLPTKFCFVSMVYENLDSKAPTKVAVLEDGITPWAEAERVLKQKSFKEALDWIDYMGA